MAGKINLSSKEAVSEIKNLNTELVNLKKVISKINSAEGDSFKTIKKTITSLRASITKIDGKFKTLNKVLSMNNTQMKHNTRATKDNTIAVNTLTPAIEKLTKEKNKSTRASNKNSKAVKEEKSSYSKLEAALKEAKDSVRSLTLEQGKNATSTKKARQNYLRLKQQMQSVNSSIEKQKGAYARLNTSLTKAKTKLQNLTVSEGKNAKQTKRAAAEYKRLKRQMDKVNGSITKTRSGFTRMLGGVKNLIAGFGILGAISLFGRLIKNTFSLIKTFDSLNFTIAVINKDLFKLQQSHIFLSQLVNKFGVDLVSTANRFIKFSAAAKNSGLSLKETQDIFRSMTKASAVLGLKTDELSGIYLALEQMLSKGKVTTEELRRQLGERLPGAMGIMAASLGVTIVELDRMLKAGEVLSAEALPRFAKAVEIAFGIESIEKVENLQSSLGRLAGSWQLFVDKVINSESQVSNVIKTWLDSVNSVFVAMTREFASDKALLEFEVAITQDQARLNEDSASVLAVEKELGIKLHDLRVATADASIVLKAATNKKEREIAEKAHKEAFQAQLNFGDKVAEERRKRAKQTLADQEEKAKELKEFLFPTSESGMALITGRNEDDILSFGGLGGTKDDLIGALGRMEGRINDAKLALEKGVTATFIEDEELDEPKFAKLKEGYDLEFKLRVEQLKRIIKNNEDLSEAEGAGFETRERLLKENIALTTEMRENQFVDEKFRQEVKQKNEIEAVKKSTATAKDKEIKIKEIITNGKKQQKIILTKFNKRNSDDEIKFANESLQIQKEQTDLELELIKLPFNNRKIIELEKLKFVKKGSDEYEKIMADIEQIDREYAIAALKYQATLIDAKLLNLNIDESIKDSYLAKLNEIALKIAELENQALPEDEDGLDPKTFQDKLLEILDIMGEFNQAVGELTDNLFQRTIDNIDAEINAEAEKYDKLIELAEGNDVAQQTLERNKELRLRELERQRVEQERKQAKARKAFAVADIAINTASAIIRQYVDSPFPVATGFAGIIAALGAIQIAAVLAEPIPQYAEGGISPKNEKALINDGGRQEYIERNGQLLTTTQSNAVVDLKKGDIIYPNFEAMQKNSMIMSAISQGGNFKDTDFDSLFLGIEKGIKKGFNKAKISNLINIQESDNSYRDKISRW